MMTLVQHLQLNLANLIIDIANAAAESISLLNIDGTVGIVLLVDLVVNQVICTFV